MEINYGHSSNRLKHVAVIVELMFEVYVFSFVYRQRYTTRTWQLESYLQNRYCLSNRFNAWLQVAGGGRVGTHPI